MNGDEMSYCIRSILSRGVSWAAFCLLLFTRVLTAQITGTVTNGTTNKPASGDQVILFSLSGGMQEIGRATTDNAGRFSLTAPDPGVQHLVRVVHQGVNYHRAAPQGTTNAEITVYDSATHVENMIAEGRVFRVQASGAQLEVSEMYTLRNESNPPLTQMSDRTFVVTIPQEAQLTDGMAAGPGGMPVTTSPLSLGSGRYAFAYPLRPGRTQLQISYKLPYTGSRAFAFTADMPLAELGVMLPKSMQFTSSGENFAPASDENGLMVFVAKSVSAGQPLKFSVSGEGSAPRGPESAVTGESIHPEQRMASPGQAADNGGPLPYLFGSLLIVVGGGIWFMRQHRPEFANRIFKQNVAKPTGGSVLSVLKEEMFRLEVDSASGKISEQEYQDAKAGLEALLRRQLKTKEDPEKHVESIALKTQ
jgi:hypothetical protein